MKKFLNFNPRWNFLKLKKIFEKIFEFFFKKNPDQKGTKVHVKLVLTTHNPPYQYTIHPAHERDFYMSLTSKSMQI